jgi:hypothetical protein
MTFSTLTLTTSAFKRRLLIVKIGFAAFQAGFAAVQDAVLSSTRR